MSTSWTSLRQRFVGLGGDNARPRRGLKSLYGLATPYDFTRAIPLIVAIFLLAVFVATAAAAAHFGKLHWGTYRSIYFVYLCALALAAAMTSFAPRLAWSLIALSLIDFTLGISSPILARMNDLATTSVLPVDSAARAFAFHPLLHAVPTPNFSGDNPFGVNTAFWQASPIQIHHDSHGLRGAERDASRLKRQIVIAAVGGSTTYDIGVTNGQTWPDVLEQQLGGEYAVLNHGVPGYSTAEHLIQTLFYLDAYDVTPRCAIYYVGWNDIHNAHIPNLDPGYANYHQLEEVAILKTRRTPFLAAISPVANIVVRYLQTQLDTVPAPEDLSKLVPMRGSDSRLEAIYRRNLQAIAAVNATRGITTIFVGQVLDRGRLADGRTHRWWPLVRDDDLWPLQERFNAILKETANSAGVPAFVLPVEKFHGSDFVDQGHFSAEGSRKFATMLAPLVRASCQQKTQSQGAAQ